MSAVNPKLRPLFLIIFVDILALTLVIPYLPFYAERFGASPFQVGLILTVFAFFQFLSGPILGKMSDRMGRRPILLISQIGTLLGFIILAFAPNLWVVYFARILDGATAGNISVAQAAISDITRPEERAKAFSLIGVSFSLGFVVGPAISGFLIRFGPAAPALAAAFFSLLSILGTYFGFRDCEIAHPKKEPFRLKAIPFQEFLGGGESGFKQFFAMPRVRSLLTQFFIFNLSFSSHISCFALFAERRLTYHGAPFTPKEVGYLFAYLGFLGIIIRSVLIDRLRKSFGESRTALIGYFAQGIGFMSYAFVDTLGQALAVATLSSIGSGLIRPALASLMSKEVGPKEQGSLFGVSQSLASIASIIAPLIAGFLLGSVSTSSWAIFSGAVIFFVLPFYFSSKNNLEPRLN